MNEYSIYEFIFNRVIVGEMPMSDGRASRKQKERVRRKRDILSTALRLFSQRGFRNVSMQEIADAAGYAVGTLYNLFDSKDALFDELLDHGAAQIKAAFLEILAGQGTEAERLSRLFSML